MTTELTWLSYTVLMTGLFWLPYILDRLAVRGPIAALMDRQAETGEHHSAWAKRAMCAHRNAVENLVLFAPAVLVAHAAGVSTPVTQGAVVVYFAARALHFVIYTLGVPLLRTLAFAAGWAATLAIVLAVLGLV